MEKKGKKFLIWFSAIGSATAYNIAYGDYLQQKQEFPIFPEDACESSINCPIKAGEATVYSASVKVPDYHISVCVLLFLAFCSKNHMQKTCSTAFNSLIIC